MRRELRSVLNAVWPRASAAARRLRDGLIVLEMIATMTVAAHAGEVSQLEELKNLSIEDLSNIEITSVSKRPEALSEASAAVYVITGDDIRNSGAASLPEALRLAPNLEVARINSQDYTISARGFNSANAADKLLVLIDGRTVYSPFFHAVNWNQQNVMLADVERIEVISGPGGTLWGANAVNGVINIITKNSAETQGGLVDLKAGNFDQNGSGRWGGKFGTNGTYRAYAMGFGRGDTDLRSTGGNANDGWNGRQVGFRSDWNGQVDTLSLQGDAYENQFDIGGRANGGNILGRWSRRLDNGSTFELQSYYDRADEQPNNAVEDNVDTFDIQFQHVIPLAERHEVVWGVGQRVWSDKFTPLSPVATIVPGNQTLALSNVFAQDTIKIFDDLKLTLGTKLEYNTFSGFEPLPSARLAWQVNPRNLLWTSVSRAVETPSRLDRNLVLLPPFFGPSPNFQSEKLIAYETGYRTQFSDQASLSVSLYYNDYSDIRTTTLTGGTPVGIFANSLQGHTVGGELWGEYKPFSWWRLTPGVSFIRKSLHVKPGGNDIAGIQTAQGIDPGHQLFLRSYWQLGSSFNFYVGLRQVGSLALAHLPAYFEADARVAWQATPDLELSLTGQNLVHDHHYEAQNGFSVYNKIPRSVMLGLRRSF